MVPDALSCGANLVAGLAARRFTPATAPDLPLALVSVAERLTSGLEVAAPFSPPFVGRSLLSVVFLSAAFLSPLLPTDAEAFRLPLAAAVSGFSLAGLTIFLLSNLSAAGCFAGFFSGDLEAVFLAAGALVGFSAGMVGAATYGYLVAATVILGLDTAGAAFLAAGALVVEGFEA